MTRNRLEAFSDGVLAILITIMVLEMKVPHEATWAALSPVLPTFLSYTLSFAYLAIYWNNHHHMMHAVKQVDGRIMWANMRLLFWLSLVPFTTGWLGENGFAKVPSALYGFNLLLSALACFKLQNTIIRSQGADSELKRAVGNDWKGKASLTLYVLGIAIGFYNQWLAMAVYVAVAIIWFVPDQRIEKWLAQQGGHTPGTE
ncbi:MAG: DUF1211 domain-containing protein [Armatimonadetes bacterium]|nr:DUF1211 domain-containing protein [Armatimonadota bacterium]MBX3109120.1 DUF1211 domain-containing protein [Fimbriimonadaceae bacterium]